MNAVPHLVSAIGIASAFVVGMFQRNIRELFAPLSGARRHHVPKLLEISPDGLCICADGIVSYINSAGLRLLGVRDASSVNGQAISSFLHPDYRMLCDDNFVALLNEASATPMKILRPSGEFLDVRMTVQTNPENAREVVVSIRDISDFMRANREVALQLKRLDNILDTAADAIIVCDEAGLIQSFNRAAVAMFRCPATQMIGQPLDGLFDRRSSTGPMSEPLDFANHPFALAGVTQAVTCSRADGSLFPAEMSLSVCQLDRQRLFTAMIRDITERRRFEANLAHSATHDGLTGLPNRTMLQERLRNILQQGVPSGTLISVWFIDLGGLKVVNDVLGHDAGDELLINAGRRMIELVQPNGTVARFGGDEFALIEQGFTSEADIVARVDFFMKAMTSRPFLLKGREVTLNVTAGIAVYPQLGNAPGDLLLDASAAMMFAKIGGRNQYRFFEPAMHRESADRLMLENELRRGIERGELLLHYQPQVEAKSGRIVGLEALVRWRHPTMGLVSPARFIPISEQTGLIVPLGEWVLHQACKDLGHLMEIGFGDVSVAVNLSAKQFSDSDVVGLVQSVIAQNGFHPRRLDLEITESALMNDPEHVVLYLNRLKALGVNLSIDDFGTGYSSLNYLKRFPVDTLKIDQSFIAEIASSSKDEAIAVTIITMAHAMGMTALAEGVEDISQTEILLHHGCDIIQGYLYSRPLPFDDIVGTLRAGPIKPKGAKTQARVS